MFKSGYDNYFENKPGSGFDTEAQLPKDETKPENIPADSSAATIAEPEENISPDKEEESTEKIEVSQPKVPLKKESEKDLNFGVGTKLKIGEGEENQGWMIVGTEDGVITLAKLKNGKLVRKRSSKDDLRRFNGVSLETTTVKTAEETKKGEGSKTAERAEASEEAQKAAEVKRYNEGLLKKDIDKLNEKAKEKGIGQRILAFLQRNSKARIAGGLLLAGTRVLTGDVASVIVAQATLGAAGGTLTLSGIGAMGREKAAFRQADPILSTCLDERGELDPGKLSQKVASGEIKLDQVKELYMKFTEIASAKGREINIQLQRKESEANVALRAEMEKGFLGNLRSKFNKMPIWGKILAGGALAILLGYGGAAAGGAIAVKMGASAAVAAKSAMMTRVIASAVPGLLIGAGSKGPQELPQAYERSDVILGLSKVIEENGGITAEDQKEFEEYRNKASKKRAGGAIAGGAIGAAIPLALAAIFGHAEPANASGKIDANNRAGVPYTDHDPNLPKNLEVTKARLVGGAAETPSDHLTAAAEHHTNNPAKNIFDHQNADHAGGQHHAGTEHQAGAEHNTDQHSSKNADHQAQIEQKPVIGAVERIEGGHHWNLTGKTGEFDSGVRLSKEEIDGLLDKKLVNPNAAKYLHNLMEKGIVKPGDVALSRDGRHLLFLNSGEHGVREMNDNAVWVSNIKPRGFLGMFGPSKADSEYVQSLIKQDPAQIDHAHSTPAPHPLEHRDHIQYSAEQDGKIIAEGKLNANPGGAETVQQKSGLNFVAEQNKKVIAEGNSQTEPAHGGIHQDFTIEQGGRKIEASFEPEVKSALEKKIEVTTQGNNVEAKFSGPATHDLPDRSNMKFSNIPADAVEQMKKANPNMTPYEMLQRYKDRLMQIDLAKQAEAAKKAAEEATKH